MRPYQAQLARVERFLNRISTPNANRDEYEDFFWAFFQNCWHLRDWIKHDSSISTTKRQSIARAVARSSILKVCGCTANRSKHYKLRWKIPPHLKKSGKWRPRRIVQSCRRDFNQHSRRISHDFFNLSSQGQEERARRFGGCAGSS
jgi:hypothetical protein